MSPAEIIGAVALAVGLSATAWWAMDARRIDTDLIAVELRVGREADIEAVQTFLGALSGFLGQGRRPKVQPFVSLEVHASHRGIRHRLVAPAKLREAIEGALAAHLPRVGYSVTGSVDYPKLDHGVEVRLTTGARPLLVDETIGPRLLGMMQPLRPDEYAVVQVVVGPARVPKPARIASAQEQTLPPLLGTGGALRTSEATTALRHKQAHPMVVACLRVGVRAASQKRAEHLMARIGSAWRSTAAPGVALRRRKLPTGMAARRITELSVPRARWPVLLNAAEAAALSAFATSDIAMPGVEARGCPPMPLAQAISRTGVVLGAGTHPRTARPAALTVEGRRHHLLVTGATGSGKSVLATRLAVGSVEHPGSSLIVIDPKDGELIERICERLPEDRLDDVIILDPTDPAPAGFDPLRAAAGQHELVVDRVLHLMATIWGSNVGPRSSDILRHLLLAISVSDDLTMAELPDLLTDPQLRQRVMHAAGDRYGLRGWSEGLERLGEREVANMMLAPANKARAFAGRSDVAAVIGQADPAINLGAVLNDGKILLVRLPAGLMGEETTALLGALVVSQIWGAITNRAAIAPQRRRPATIIIDEAASVLRFPAASLEGLLTQSRGYGVSVTLLAQQLAQLPKDLRSAALTNARTKLVFAPSHDDAAVWARHLGAGLTAQDLMELEAYHAVAAVFADGRTQGPATIATLPLDKPLRPAAEVLERSRASWGVPRGDVEATIRHRLHSFDQHKKPPVGRRRRTS